MARKNQLSITAHIFDNTGSVYLRTEDVIIPLPAIFIPCKSPRADIDINSKIVYGHESGFVEEIYVEETIDELDDMVEEGGEVSVFFYDTDTGLKTTAVRYYDTDDDSIIGTVQHLTI